MALAMRLRRAIVVTPAASSFALLLRLAAFASIRRPHPRAPFVQAPLLLPRRPWLLLGAAAGFRSTAAAAADTKMCPDDDEVPANGMDYKHWLFVMRFPDPQPSREEMIETYLQTIAKVFGSYEEAKRRMYAFCTTDYTGFQATMTQEMAEQFYGLPGVITIMPDAYVRPEKKEYGGDKYDNGVITPFRPRYDWGKSSRPDKNHTLGRNDLISPSHQARHLAERMIMRRFVNIVTENYKSGMYSLHRLDVSKHLFYLSAAEADVAAASKKKGAVITPRLEKLPPPYIRFQPSPTTLSYKVDQPLFALLSRPGCSSEDDIISCNTNGHSVLYNIKSHSILSMPTMQGFTGIKPTIISTGHPDAPVEDLYVLHSGFHVLRFGPIDRSIEYTGSPKAWHWDSLPRPPIDTTTIMSHTLIDGGRTICVSSSPDGFGTYCFDTVEREWRHAGNWVLPFLGGVEYIPDLELWLGHSSMNPCHLCVTSDLSNMEQLIAMEQPPLVSLLKDLGTPKNWIASRFKLINLGGGRFCAAKVFQEVPMNDVEDFAVLTGIELVTSGSGGSEKLEMIRVEKSVRYEFTEDVIRWEL